MANLNVPADHSVKTHEGAPAVANLTPEQQLRRSVMVVCCGKANTTKTVKSIADRIVENARKVDPHYLAELAKEVRHRANLRHAPLLLLDVLSEPKKMDVPSLVADTIYNVISRPDELSEFLAVYWRNGRKSVSHQIRLGLGKAFGKFSEYSLAKYDRDGAIKLRDVMRICHPKPVDEAKAALYKKVLDRTLTTPDTWETNLSAGKDKKETFERLIREGNLGYFALIRNLRNMEKAGCDRNLVISAITARKNGADKILPFRFVAAARAAPSFEAALDEALIATLAEAEKFEGKTAILVDISGSMNHPLSGKSEMTRMDAAAALAALFPADRKNVRIFSFSSDVKEVPNRVGMAGVDAIVKSQYHGGTNLGQAVKHLVGMDLDRVIVLTDEQSHDRVGAPNIPNAWMINVASYRNGVGYGHGWNHVDGWSDNIFAYMRERENEINKIDR